MALVGKGFRFGVEERMEGGRAYMAPSSMMPVTASLRCVASCRDQI